MANFEKKVREMTEITAVQEVKSAVDHVLGNTFLADDSSYARLFAGKLSTSPITTSKEITPEMLKGKCGIISGELQDGLEKQYDAPVDMKISDHPKAVSGHKYLSTVRRGIEVIIDASIGQYIKGHTHVFVGTRAKLKQLILASRGKIINTQADLANRPEEFFTRTWGLRTGVVSRKGSLVKVPA